MTYKVISAIEVAYQSLLPRSLAAVYAVVQQAINLFPDFEIKFGQMIAGDSIALYNGPLVTTIYANGQIIVMRGSQVILSLPPP